MADLISPPKLRSALPAVDISGFFQAVSDAFNLHLKTVKWPLASLPTFVHSFPQERLAVPSDPFDVVTFSLGGAEMAAMSNDGSRVPRAPLLREVADSTTLFGYKSRTMAWKEDVAVVFSIWSRSNARADALVNWFHRFIMTYAYAYRFFEARGVDLFFFLKRGRDEVEEVENQELYKRTLVYRFRIEYVMPVLDAKTLESVTINVGLGDTQVDTINLPPPHK